MSKKVNKYLLRGMVEYDEKATKKAVEENIKRGKGSQK